MAPEKCENVYLRSRYISQVFVHGDSLKVSALFSRWLPDFSSVAKLSVAVQRSVCANQ